MESHYYRKIVSVVALLVILGAAGKAHAICNVPLGSLEKCIPAARPPNPPPPSGECCNTLARADLPCFCSYRNNPILGTFGVDPNLARQLPRKCGIPGPHC